MEILSILDDIIEIAYMKMCERITKKRKQITCEGCSALAVQLYGYGGHPSQHRHMGIGGCLSR